MKTDAEIQKDVMAELRWEPALNATEIGIAVNNGIVTLNGHVSNYGKKFAAEKAAWRVKGVKAVAEELQVRLADDDSLTDEEVAASVLNILKWHTAIPDEKIRVKVTRGFVTLDGEVDWNYQKESAWSAIRFLKGVTGIANLITIKPRVNAAVVKEDIRKALERNAGLEAGGITVDTLGNKVTLKGKARSFHEKQLIERAAWSAPGVYEVEDHILIDHSN